MGDDVIRSFENITPTLAANVYIDSAALVSGDVTIGEDSSVWPMAVVRGDVNRITIGARSNVQDNSVLHVTHKREQNPEGFALQIGDDVTIGHSVVLHGCRIEARCLIGISVVILDGAVVESDTMIGAGSLVPPGKHLDSGFLWVGSPVQKKRPLTAEEKAFLSYSAAHYVRLKNRHQGA